MSVVQLRHAKDRRDMQRICGNQYQDKVKPFMEAIEFRAMTMNRSYEYACESLKAEMIEFGANGDCLKMLNAAFLELSNE